MVMSVVLETSGFTVKFKVANESQPAAEVNVAVCDPDPANVKPFHEYGRRSSQMVISVVLETSGITATVIFVTVAHSPTPGVKV